MNYKQVKEITSGTEIQVIDFTKSFVSFEFTKKLSAMCLISYACTYEVCIQMNSLKRTVKISGKKSYR